MLVTGAKLGPYEIISLAGSGGMGEVYRARDTRLDRIVAIKIISASHSSDGGRRQRFEREAREIMEGFISFHLDVEFKSYKIFKSLL